MSVCNADTVSWNDSLLHAIMENTPDLIFVKDREGRIIVANTPTLEAIGKPAEAVIGHTDADLYPDPATGLAIMENDRRVMDSGQTEVIEELVPGPHGIRIFLSTKSPYRDAEGHIVGIVGVAHDITRRKRMEEELRFKNAILETQSNVSIDGILVVDGDGKIISFNKRFVEIWGIPQDILAAESDEMAVTHVLDKLTNPDEFTSRIRYLYEHRDESSHEEILLKDGRTLDRYSAPMKSHDGPCFGRVWYFRDITARKQAQEDARLAYEQLERTHRELKDTQTQLVQSEKLVSIGHLAAGVAHEINNPVGFVACNFEVLEGYTRTFTKLIDMYENLAEMVQHPDRGNPYAKVISIHEWRRSQNIDYIMNDVQQLFKDSRDGLDRIAWIVQSLRGFSTVNLPAELGDYNINEGIKATAVVIGEETRYHCDVKLRLGEIPPVHCHAGQMHQVFLNIMVNASQAIESQNRPDIGTITVRTYVDGRDVVCEIEDDGPGIPEEVLSRIFDPFFTTKPVGQGTGLGLSVSHDIIVNKHKGSLYVKTATGKGTVFTIRLPVKRAEVTAEAPK